MAMAPNYKKEAKCRLETLSRTAKMSFATSNFRLPESLPFQIPVSPVSLFRFSILSPAIMVAY